MDASQCKSMEKLSLDYKSFRNIPKKGYLPKLCMLYNTSILICVKWMFFCVKSKIQFSPLKKKFKKYVIAHFRTNMYAE